MKCKKCKEEKHDQQFSLYKSKQSKGKIICDSCQRHNVRKIVNRKK